MHTSAMKRANGSTVGAWDQIASEKETLAGSSGRRHACRTRTRAGTSSSKRRPPPTTWHDSVARATDRSMKTTDPRAGPPVNPRIDVFDRRFPRDLGWEVVAP